MSTSQFVIFVFAFFALFEDVTPNITVYPQNAIIVVSGSARFNCTTNLTSTTNSNPISWNFNGAGKLGRGSCSGSDTRFQGVPQGDTQECDLVVLSNQADVAGTYVCSDYDVAKQREATLLVLASLPTCKPDQPPVKNQQVNVTCKPGNVTYGTPPIMPVTITQYTTCESLGISLGISNGATVGPGIVPLPDASFSVTPSGKVLSAHCTIHFDVGDNYPPQTDTIWATNDLNYTVDITELVHYCPENINVTKGPYFAGSLLNCSADGYTEPTYSWTNNSNNSPSSQLRTISLPAGEFDLNCTATGNLASPCNISVRVQGYAIECPHDVVIPSKLTVIKVGQSFNCTATSSPAANYTWYNATGVVSYSQMVTVTAPGPFLLTCNATVTQDSTTCSSNTSDTVNGTAIECPGSMLITPQTTTVRVGDSFNCSTSSYPSPANFIWFDSSTSANGALLSSTQNVTVRKAGNFSFTCNASISVDGMTCFNFTTITGHAISCPPNVTISPQDKQPLFGTVYNCSSDSSEATYTWTDGTTAPPTAGSFYTADKEGSFTLTCNATVLVDGVSCSNVAVINITVIATTTVAPTTTTMPTTTTPATTTTPVTTPPATTTRPPLTTTPTANTASSMANSGSTAPVNTGTATTIVGHTGSGASTANTLSPAYAGSAASAIMTPNTGSTVSSVTGITGGSVSPGGGSGSGSSVTTTISGVSANPPSNTSGNSVNPNANGNNTTINPNSLNNTSSNQTGSGQTSTTGKVDQAKIISVVIIPFVGVVAIIGAVLLVRFCLTRGAAARKLPPVQKDISLETPGSFFQRPERPYGQPSVYNPGRESGPSYTNGYGRF